MPLHEPFWNPYRWVEVPEKPSDYRSPYFHHKFTGTAGKIQCRLTALTPLFVNDGQGRPCERDLGGGRRVKVIPGTSLKGVIRSLAEIVGNGVCPFSSNAQHYVDEDHCVEMAARGTPGKDWKLDVVSRTFGLLSKGRGGEAEVLRGHIRISDALPDPLDQQITLLKQVKLIGASPRPQHRAFYPDRQRRKLYHHQPGTTSLPDCSNVASDRMLANAQALPPGTTFAFEVNFWNLDDAELGLLLYCLFLEEEVTVRLSKEAAGGNEATLTGPMRHKVGGAKPYGAGSVAIEPLSMRLCTDMGARYRGRAAERWHVFEGERLREEIRRRTEHIRKRTDKTMQQLRAMLVYDENDPRTPVHWPTRGWFSDHPSTPLKPTC